MIISAVNLLPTQPTTFLTLWCPFPQLASYVTSFLLMTMLNHRFRHLKGRKGQVPNTALPSSPHWAHFVPQSLTFCHLLPNLHFPKIQLHKRMSPKWPRRLASSCSCGYRENDSWQLGIMLRLLWATLAAETIKSIVGKKSRSHVPAILSFYNPLSNLLVSTTHSSEICHA